MKTRLSDVVSILRQTWNVIKHLLNEDKKEANRDCNTNELVDTIYDFFQTKLLCTKNTISLLLTTTRSIIVWPTLCSYSANPGQFWLGFGRWVLQLISKKSCEVVTAYLADAVIEMLCRHIRIRRRKNCQLVFIWRIFVQLDLRQHRFHYYWNTSTLIAGDIQGETNLQKQLSDYLKFWPWKCKSRSQSMTFAMIPFHGKCTNLQKSYMTFLCQLSVSTILTFEIFYLENVDQGDEVLVSK